MMPPHVVVVHGCKLLLYYVICMVFRTSVCVARRAYTAVGRAGGEDTAAHSTVMRYTHIQISFQRYY